MNNTQTTLRWLMKRGDLVRKREGMDAGQTGLVMHVVNKDSPGHVILVVVAEGEWKNWAAHLVEVRSRSETR